MSGGRTENCITRSGVGRESMRHKAPQVEQRQCGSDHEPTHHGDRSVFADYGNGFDQ